MKLLIVESPAKAKTLKKYLPKDFEVKATFGHIRDLIPKEGAVDPANDFSMKYQAIEKNAKHTAELLKFIKKAEEIFLATDPDREGEAISWHVVIMALEKKLAAEEDFKRVAFHEITKAAVQHAVANPRELSMELVNAQQARRALDYLVGFNLSPLLWKKIRRGLSAGRVQSPALRMIVEREEEIEKFIAKEYWSIEADCHFGKKDFMAKLTEYQGEKQKQFSITNEADATAARDSLIKSANGELEVAKIEKKKRKRNPAAPFTTSTLQQEASRKLGFGAQRTMRIAQQLYEGIDIGEGATGLITYMRTDSVSLANEAIAEIRDVIESRYGEENLPDSPRMYKTKAKNAQEAHEAVRPTSAQRHPDSIKGSLSTDQYKLYRLIWMRTVACQMIHATIDTVSVDLSCGPGNMFRATGSTIAVPGFMLLYQEGQDDAKAGDGDEKLLPPMEQGDKIPLKQIRSEQHFTEPPPRYSEASLVKSLEEHGIGRPSTYAAIISTLQNREYVLLEKKRFHPTDVGRVVNRFLTEYFTKYVDYSFTANLEDELDAVSRGEKEWRPLLHDFWSPFKDLIDHTEKNVQRKDVTQEKIEEKCPTCGEQLAIRLGRRGRFIGCTAYPDCDYTRNLDDDEKEPHTPEVVEDRKCPKCESELHIKKGRYGKFIGCSAYPNCNHMEPLEKPKDTEVQCPKCEKHNILERKSRKGKVFYSCAGYPKCTYAIWNYPLDEKCPKCDWPILSVKTTKRRGTEKVCPQKDCDFCEAVEDDG